MTFLKICKYLSFGSIAVLAVYMAAASVLEKFHGADAVMEWGYHSPVFIALWAVAALAGAVTLYGSAVRSRKRQDVPVFTVSLHLALMLILAGALTTHVLGRQGTLHLRVGEPALDEFMLDDGPACPLPFSVSLSDFRVEYHPGSYAPEDYVSTIECGDVCAEVSMNRILKYRGYRFYQSTYDEDGGGATLAVSHDPAGVAVTYTGYLLLLVSMAGFFFQKRSGFRTALSRAAKGAAAVFPFLVLMFSSPADASAADFQGGMSRKDVPRHLPARTADAYGRMYVYYNDRICPVQTLARDFTMKLYGHGSYRGLSCEQVLTGWIFYYESWAGTLDDAAGKGRKAEMKARDRAEAVRLVCSGSVLKIFPYADAEGKVEWYSAVDRLPYGMDSGQWLFVRKVMSLAGESVAKGDFDGAAGIFGKICTYQQKTALEVLPAGWRVSAERCYNALEHPGAAAMLTLCVGIVLFLLSCFSTDGMQPKGRPGLKSVHVLSWIVLAYLCVIFILRWCVSGHVPMSNGFETMWLMALVSMLLTVIFCRSFQLVQPFGFLMCGFALLVSSLGESDPKITYMMPVLSSPLLSLHVTCMMLSYTLLGILMLNGVMALLRYPSENRRKGAAGTSAGRSADIGTVILYPAVFLLAAGTFLGAVWANISWGRYWGWDPKEVWALITLLVYAFALHGRSLKAFRRPVFFHWYCVVAFICVIVTYFGVNFFLGGLHSYA